MESITIKILKIKNASVTEAFFISIIMQIHRELERLSL